MPITIEVDPSEEDNDGERGPNQNIPKLVKNLERMLERPPYSDREPDEDRSLSHGVKRNFYKSKPLKFLKRLYNSYIRKPFSRTAVPQASKYYAKSNYPKDDLDERSFLDTNDGEAPPPMNYDGVESDNDKTEYNEDNYNGSVERSINHSPSRRNDNDGYYASRRSGASSEPNEEHDELHESTSLKQRTKRSDPSSSSPGSIHSEDAIKRFSSINSNGYQAPPRYASSSVKQIDGSPGSLPIGSKFYGSSGSSSFNEPHHNHEPRPFSFQALGSYQPPQFRREEDAESNSSGGRSRGADDEQPKYQFEFEIPNDSFHSEVSEGRFSTFAKLPTSFESLIKADTSFLDTLISDPGNYTGGGNGNEESSYDYYDEGNQNVSPGPTHNNPRPYPPQNYRSESSKFLRPTFPHPPPPRKYLHASPLETNESRQRLTREFKPPMLPPSTQHQRHRRFPYEKPATHHELSYHHHGTSRINESSAAAHRISKESPMKKGNSQRNSFPHLSKTANRPTGV